MKGPGRAFAGAGFRLVERGVSALCRYRGRGAKAAPLPVCLCDTDAGQADLARFLPEVSYPALPYADVSFAMDGVEYRFSCDADFAKPRRAFFLQADLSFDALKGVFLDPFGVYEGLQEPSLEPAFSADGPWSLEALFEAAAICSRTPYEAPAAGEGYARGECPPAMQRDLLTLVLTGAEPWKGLALLRASGFIEREWPEIAQIYDVEHSKEYHPEGGAWDHTLETFRYRKDPELILSLALLLHDAGKPLSVSTDGKRFDRHAELGVRAVRSFLGRLGYPTSMVEEISFLVRNHMLPAALPRLPLMRTEEALESPLFPTLLELFRCDMSSTFMGPGSYYDACAAFKRYKRNVKNPYRSADGTKRDPRTGSRHKF